MTFRMGKGLGFSDASRSGTENVGGSGQWSVTTIVSTRL